MINRLRDSPEQKAAGYNGPHTFDTVVKTKTWGDAARWQREAAAANRISLVFTCSLSDFFIQDADPWRLEAWQIIKRSPNLIFQILTKRPSLIKDRLPPDWGTGYPNVWLGVSVESSKFLPRMDELRKIPAAARFVSAEPLLEDIAGGGLEKHIDGFHQIIVGGESGNNSDFFRPMDHAWAVKILKICRRHGIAFFFKQSAARKTEMGTLVEIDGVKKKIQEYPAHYVEYQNQLAKKGLFQ